MSRQPARFYFDVISPYAALAFSQLSALEKQLEFEFVPVLFAGLLKHWTMKGPAELPAKRVHTYRHCVWIARQLGVPFRMPPRHPFNPLAALRLLIARGLQRDDMERTFAFIWQEGRDPEHEMDALAARLGEPDWRAATARPEVKSALVASTEAAATAGLWGVPTIEVRGEFFWGVDTLDWVRAFAADPGLLAAEDFRRADATGEGITRR
jgi:2-hydroxychromene-2-carboxylate isomerase